MTDVRAPGDTRPRPHPFSGAVVPAAPGPAPARARGRDLARTGALGALVVLPAASAAGCAAAPRTTASLPSVAAPTSAA
ncbi:MAG TPA: hypothetical protein DHV14_11465, partial [Micrococcales bacterium]|nr:hypothetical protein [Micrococcales bacterium]